MNEIIIESESASAKYKNIYIDKCAYTELHITDGAEHNSVYLVDSDIVEDMKKHFWCEMFIGKSEYRQAKVYYNKNRIKYYLNEFVIDDNKIGGRILFLNRDTSDYRKHNLRRIDYGQFQERTVARGNNRELPNCIYEYKHEGVAQGYIVSMTADKQTVSKTFSFKKHATKEEALEMAIQFRNSFYLEA